MATQIFKTYDTQIAAGVTDIQSTPVVPSGKTVHLNKVFWADPSIGDNLSSIIAIQWGQTGGWETVVAGCGQFERLINRTFLGDGVKSLRVLRINKSAQAKIIIASIEATIRDR